MFSTLHKTNFKFSVTFTLSSANAFDSDKPKILLFGNELKSTLSALLPDGKKAEIALTEIVHLNHLGPEGSISFIWQFWI